MARRSDLRDPHEAPTGDLFAHFGVDLAPPLASARAARPTPAAPCPRCSWLCVAVPCLICGYVRAARLRERG